MSISSDCPMPSQSRAKAGRQEEKYADATSHFDALALPNTDWLRHDLTISGPALDIERLMAAAAGSGAIPWFYPELDFEEDDRFLALVTPPDGSRGLSPAAARILAHELREASFQHQAKIRVQTAVSKACRFDLHALIPVPADMLERGPDHRASLDWLRAHWGTVQALRRVQITASKSATKRRRIAECTLEFWSADWTPWPAIESLRRVWPTLKFTLQPDYRDG